MTDIEIVNSIKKQIQDNQIIIYIKGSPDSPACGFTASVAKIMMATDYEFGFIDIFEYPEIRRLLPTITNWHTFPQIFINGEFIGGCDILVEMNETGELQKLLSTLKR